MRTEGILVGIETIGRNGYPTLPLGCPVAGTYEIMPSPRYRKQP